MSDAYFRGQRDQLWMRFLDYSTPEEIKTLGLRRHDTMVNWATYIYHHLIKVRNLLQDRGLRYDMRKGILAETGLPAPFLPPVEEEEDDDNDWADVQGLEP